MVNISYIYNERLPYHLLTMDGYHIIYLQWTFTITFCTIGGYHNIYLQWTVFIASSYNGRLP